MASLRTPKHTLARSVLAALAVSAIALTSLGANAAEPITTFSAESAGCAGGGKVCGTFPPAPVGDAEYDHAASTDGSVEVSATAEGGLPIPACPPVRCVGALGQYHAEAVARVWTDIDLQAGSPVVIAAWFDVDTIEASAEETVGSAESNASIELRVDPAPGSTVTCSTGDVAGLGGMTYGPGATGDHVFDTEITCEDEGATLKASRVRVSLVARVDATTDGGEASATVEAALERVQVSP